MFSPVLFVLIRRPMAMIILLAGGLLTGCQPAVYLMPTPVALESDDIQSYRYGGPDLEGNVVKIFYATNRLPLWFKNSRVYTTGLTDTLHLGQAEVRIGEKGKPWDFLKALSTTEQREEKIKLELDKTRELAELEGNIDLPTDGEDARVFIDAINQALQENISKDITVYINGATASFYTAVAQAAQIRHFTGYNHVVLAFSWPTAESFLYYGTDVENALKTSPLFARLIRFLAQHTDVQKINVLAYSAGGQVASPGLSMLGSETSGLSNEEARGVVKLGEIYFAAPDVEMKSYVQHLPDYINLGNSTTIAFNPEDFVLRLSSLHQGNARIGRPRDNVLTEKEDQWLTGQSNTGAVNFIVITQDILGSHRSGAHDFWYSHPWVSTDVLIQLLFHITPQERGLQDNYTDDVRWWNFPETYPDDIVEILQVLDDKVDKEVNIIGD